MRCSRRRVRPQRQHLFTAGKQSGGNVSFRKTEGACNYDKRGSVHPEESSNLSAISSRFVTLFQFLAVPAFFNMRSITAGNFDWPAPAG
jgi:hypothetical protein